ncbi:response regulator transcription factor [Bifidobacterium sp. MA2]|uniref:Response regulator transcription factor n=1 Tax=Bifidobacterium santillanense TaxID=2809028 RepID=A0ABS5UPW4_9BIFI|nr:response regulator transcription factor [Bifidobacterium santillanense]MBT1172986.1 response regulator transcription factor [Bifidobacterium santillanense]
MSFRGKRVLHRDAVREKRIAIVDNDILSLRCLTSVVGRIDGVSVYWMERSGQAAFDHFRRNMSSIDAVPDILLVDMSMRGMSGIDLCEAVRYENGEVILLGITSYDPASYKEEGIRAGMQGIVAKECIAEMSDYVRLLSSKFVLDDVFESPVDAHRRMVHGGKPFILLLSEREREIMEMSVRGYSAEQVAGALNISESAVKTYVARIVSKFGVANKREAIALWARKVGI